jgi:SAM-dependent methyltransferase
MMFDGRPSASPVLAGLFLSGVIKRKDAVVDLGCGDGTDCFAMAAWGVRSVDGLDQEEDNHLRAGRRLAAFKGRHGPTALGLDRITFHLGSATRFHECLGEEQFDVVIDTLLWNNIAALAPHATPGYVRQAARLLRPGGLLVLHVREDIHPLEVIPSRKDLPPSFHRFFSMSDGVSTHIAEFKARSNLRVQAHAGVAVYLGTRRARPLPTRKSGSPYFVRREVRSAHRA